MDFPLEVWNIIFWWMEYKIQNCKQVCLKWNQIITSIENTHIKLTQSTWHNHKIIPDDFALMIERQQMMKHFQKLHVPFKGDQSMVIEYTKFMQLLKYNDDMKIEILFPNAVDSIWHAHILDTMIYNEFCQLFFGRFIHHVPCCPWTYQTVVDSTWALYKKLFKTISVHNLWLQSNYDIWSCSCFEGDAKIKMADGSKKPAKNIKIGDLVMCGNQTHHYVKQIKKNQSRVTKNMVRLSDFWITRGHPVLYSGEWWRPDELYPTVARDVEAGGIINFVLDDEHTVVVGGEEEWVCCTLGKYCGKRLEKLFPQQNILYGRME